VQLIDADGSGELSIEEVLAAAPLLGLTEEQAALFFVELDDDNSGSISATEFMNHFKVFSCLWREGETLLGNSSLPPS
jgi:Ca2+-binding EF-hand superfamily protein